MTCRYHELSTNTAEKWSEDVREPGCSDSRDSLTPSRSRSYALDHLDPLERKNDGVQYSITIITSLQIAMRPWPSEESLASKVWPSYCQFLLFFAQCLTLIEASRLQILEFETVGISHPKQSLPRRKNGAGGGGRYGGCCQPDSSLRCVDTAV